MKIVQSYWSKPYSLQPADESNPFHKYFHCMSCALSCLRLSEYYPVELVTDKKGKEFLVDKMELPFTSVKEDLEYLDYPISLWASGKIIAYDLQDEPFIHVDNDIFVWDAFPERIVNAALISQGIEENFEHNNVYFNEHLEKFGYIPEEILEYRKINTNVDTINAGILGGNNISFIKEYTKEAFRFIEKNLDKVHLLDAPFSFNLMFEQYLFYCMAQNRQIPVAYYFEKNMDAAYKKLVSFWEVPHQTTYIHTISSYKKHYIIAEQIGQRLWLEYPDYFYKIQKLIQNNVL